MGKRALWLLVGLVVACGGEGAPPSTADGGAPGAGTVALSAPAPGRGTVHIVRLVARGDRYRFEPAELVVRPGDVVRFVQTGHQPEAVAFDPASAPEGGAQHLERQGVLRGPLLTEPGVFYDVTLGDAPPGEYRYFSVPHRESGMHGRIVVEP